jgi:hypothetical protein
MLFPPACSSLLITENLPGSSWPGRYMKMDITKQHSLSCTISFRLQAYYGPLTAWPGYMTCRVQSLCMLASGCGVRHCVCKCTFLPCASSAAPQHFALQQREENHPISAPAIRYYHGRLLFYHYIVRGVNPAAWHYRCQKYYKVLEKNSLLSFQNLFKFFLLYSCDFTPEMHYLHKRPPFIPTAVV